MPGAGGAVQGAPSTEAVELGSGGGSTPDNAAAGAGGGAVQIDAVRTHVPGTISARGLAGARAGLLGQCPGGGAGGAVMLRGTSLEVTGNIRVDGGNGGNGSAPENDGGGAGGGGRIKLFHGGHLTTSGTITAAGGTGGTFGTAQPGQDGNMGTIHTSLSSEPRSTVMMGPEEVLGPE
jgi:hypothetical protein